MLGKQIRLQRIMNRNTNRTIIVPLDHGLTVGPMPGLDNMPATVSQIAEGGADCVVMHKGAVGKGFRPSGISTIDSDIGLMLHLSGGTSLAPDSNEKTLVASVEDAIRLGADAVSVQVNIGNDAESRMLADLGHIYSKAAEWGIPVMAMVYARGPKITDEYDFKVVALAARVGMELGADLVKVSYTGDINTFASVVQGCNIPVVIAGGPKLNCTTGFLKMAHDSMEAGGAGLSVGRNIFQHPYITDLVRVLRDLVHHDLPLKDATRIMREIEGKAASKPKVR
jgi:class I fructose-bisphosphate aldolase